MKIGVIGFGNMGSSIAGRIKSKYEVWVFDKDRAKTKDALKIKIASSCVDLVNNADTIVLAVKPQDIKKVLEEIRDYVRDKLAISIAAGITTSYILKWLKGKTRVVRVMPNMPAKIGKGMSCLCKGKFATDKDLNLALELFNCLGKTLVLKENMMDAATAISGSGPAFWCDFIEDKPKSKWEDYSKKELIPLFACAAFAVGFGKKEAGLLAKETVMGSLATLQSLDIEPLDLKRSVASKGGTTEAGLKVLDRGGSLEEAMKAALARAKELSKKAG